MSEKKELDNENLKNVHGGTDENAGQMPSNATAIYGNRGGGPNGNQGESQG